PAAFPPPPPGSTNTRTCFADSTLQPQASELPCRATGWPSMRMVASPSTMGNAPLWLGHVAWSVTRATGMPSMPAKDEPVSTVPPLLVGSPTTIQFFAIMRSVHDRRLAPPGASLSLFGRSHLRGCRRRRLVNEVRVGLVLDHRLVDHH